MFDDKWIDKEENSKVMDFIFKWLRPVCADVLLKRGASVVADCIVAVINSLSYLLSSSLNSGISRPPQ